MAPNPHGSLAVLFEDDNLERVMYNGGTQCVKVAHRELVNVSYKYLDQREEEGLQISKKTLQHSQTFARETVPEWLPIFDGRLPDGSRVNGTIPPVSGMAQQQHS